MAGARVVANRFLQLADMEGRALTPMQVLKLVYIAHGWNLALSDAPLIEQPVEAWLYGPVIRDLYHSMKGFGGGGVRGPLPLSWEEAQQLSERQDALIRQVYRLYGGLSGVQLSGITHAEGTPWKQTYTHGDHGTVIPDSVIRDHYKRLKTERVPANNG